MNVATWLYVDTSVLVQRVVYEPGSRLASRETSASPIVTSALAPVEALSAIVARRRSGSLRPSAFEAAVRRLDDERGKWVLVEVVTAVLVRAERIIRVVPTRTLDAIHLASALFFQDTSGIPLTFLTADRKQHESAEAIGLTARSIAL